MDSETCWFAHHVLLRVYFPEGVEIIGKITRWDYLFLERGIENGASNFTWMHGRQRPHSDELVFDGVAGGGDSRVDLNLVEDGAHMSLHGAWTDHQMLSHCPIAQAEGDQAQHFHFPCGQFVGIGW